MRFKDIRASYPQYSDLTDEELAKALHSKFYSDMSFSQFSQKIGYNSGYKEPEHITKAKSEPLGVGMGDSVRAYTQGMTFGWGDEMEAFLLSLEDYATGKSEQPLENYDAWHDGLNDRMDSFSDAAPVKSTMYEIAGAIPTVISAPVTSWTKGAGLATNLGKFAVEGAGYGALAGAGTSNADTWTDLGVDTLEGAALGAVVDPLIGGTAQGLTKAFTRDADTIARNDAYGIDTQLSEQYPILKSAQNALDMTTAGAYAAGRAAQRDEKTATEAIEGMIPDELKGSQQAGQKYIDTINQWVEDTNLNLSDEFSDLRKAIDLDKKVVPTEAQSFLNSEFAVFADNPAIGQIAIPPALKRLQKALQDGEYISVDALWKLRSEVGDALKTGKFGTDDVNQAKLKQLYGALSQDLERAIRASDEVGKEAANDAADLFIELTEKYAQFIEDQSRLRPIISRTNKDFFTPEKVISEVVRMFRDEPSRLQELMNRFSPEPFAGSPLDSAGMTALYQSSLNKGSVDPQKMLERHRIGQSKTGQEPVSYGNIPSNINPIISTDYWNSPVSNLVNNADMATEYLKAVRLAERAEESLRRGTVQNIGQAVGQTALTGSAFLYGDPVITVASLIGTYGLRELLASRTVGKGVRTVGDAVEVVIKTIEDKVGVETLTANEAALLAIIASQTGEE